jgi:serine/threonine protein kinase
VCIEWEILNRKINPRTNRKIKKNGPTYKKLEKECKDIKKILAPIYQTRQYDDSIGCQQDSGTGTDLFESILNELTVAPFTPTHDVLSNIQQENPNNGGGETNIFESNVSTGGCTISNTYTDFQQDIDDIDEGIYSSYGMNYKNLKTRIQEANKVCTYLNTTITIADQQWCVSGPDKNKFNRYMDSFKILSNGTFGIVSKVYFRNMHIPVIIKEAKIMDLDIEIPTMKNIEGRFTLQKRGKKDYFSLENMILEAIDRLILQPHISPNFLLFYEATWCETCNMVVKNYKFEPGSCYLTFMEAADTDLYNIKLPTIYEQESVLYQILLGLHSLQKYLGMWHRDIKTDNIFIKRTEPGGVLKYNVDNETYYILNEGFIVYVSDFNVAECLKPGILPKKYYHLIRYDCDSHPFQVKYINNKAIGVPLKSGNKKKSNKWVNSKKNPVDLIPDPIPTEQMHSDPMQFPFKNFFGDVQDVIRMFTGGKRSTIDQLQITVKPELPEMYKRLMNAHAYSPRPSNVTTKCVKYLLAKEMLKTLYRPPSKSSGKFYIIEEFTL